MKCGAHKGGAPFLAGICEKWVLVQPPSREAKDVEHEKGRGGLKAHGFSLPLRAEKTLAASRRGSPPRAFTNYSPTRRSRPPHEILANHQNASAQPSPNRNSRLHG